jgi:hypothetical protein
LIFRLLAHITLELRNLHRCQAFPSPLPVNRNVVELQQTLATVARREPLSGDVGKKTFGIEDFPAFTINVLGWQAEDLVVSPEELAIALELNLQRAEAEILGGKAAQKSKAKGNTKKVAKSQNGLKNTPTIPGFISDKSPNH